MDYQNSSNTEKENKIANLPVFKVCSDWFECPKCGYKERRLILGDVSHTPCTECGNSVMYRVK